MSTNAAARALYLRKRHERRARVLDVLRFYRVPGTGRRMATVRLTTGIVTTRDLRDLVIDR